MSSKALLDRGRKLHLTIKGFFTLTVVCTLGMAIITGCSSNSVSLDIPKDFIMDYIAKHETLTDKSLVYYYAKEDQAAIARQIDTACRINRARGTLEILEKASFDFSELQIQVLDKKEEYMNDEPVVFLKVAIKGCYTMQLPEEMREIKANDVIILQMARNEWKVTTKNNPWS